MTAGRWDDDGSAIVEFVFVAVALMVPLVYFVVALAAVQRTQLAVGQAAREAGRAFATAGSSSQVPVRVAAALRLALKSQGLSGGVDLRFVAAGATCSSAPVVARLEPGAQFTVCVTRRASIPGVPSLLAGGSVRCIGRFTVHVDAFRTVAR